MSYHCELFDQSAQPTLSIRTRTSVEKLPQVMGDAYGAIARHLASQGEEPGGAPFALYYNMDMQDLDIEIGFPVEKVIAGKGTIQPSQIPAGKYAAVLHKGPYTDLRLAYGALTQFITDQGLKPSGLAYEFYLNDPTETTPEELKTQIIFQLKSA